MVQAEERRWHQLMVDASSDLLVFVDSTYVYRVVNQAYCEEHLRTHDEIVGHTVAEVFGESVFEATLKPPMDRCLSGERVTFDFWWDSPSRGRRHVDATYDPYFEADGSVSGVLVNARDSTERKEAEETLRQSEERFRLVLKAPVALFAQDRDLRFTWIYNPTPQGRLFPATRSKSRSRLIVLRFFRRSRSI